MIQKGNGNLENPSKSWKKKKPIIIEKYLRSRVNGELDVTDGKTIIGR